LKKDAEASFFCLTLVSGTSGSYPLRLGAQALSATRSSPVFATLREDASTSFFCSQVLNSP
jgi:hypothetical protein